MSGFSSEKLVDGPLLTVSDARCRVRRSSAGSERLVPQHEFVFVRRGIFVTHVGRRRLTADSNHVLCVSGGTPVRFSHPTDDGDTYTAIEVSHTAIREVIARYQPRLADALECPVPLASVVVTPPMLLQLHSLRAASGDPGAERLGIEESALGLIEAVVRMAQAVYGRSPKEPAPHRSSADIVESVKYVLARNPAAALSLTDLAQMVGASPFRLARLFRTEVGLPIHRYHLRLRLGLAVDRIAAGEENLSAIGHDLGFASHSHFTRAFRVAFGQPPSAVRRSIRGTRRASRHTKVNASGPATFPAVSV
jgi:AraC family transcriptional regulator